MKIAVIIPVYNEQTLLPVLFDRLINTPAPPLPDGTRCDRVIYLVDDGSRDDSPRIIDELAQRGDTIAIHQTQNQGKGAALAAQMTIAKQMDSGRTGGTRFLGQTHRVLYYWHSIANRIITLTSNMMSNLNLTDIECGFKAFTRDAIQDITITEKRFGVEPELIAKLAKIRLPDEDGVRRIPLRIYEVPISYAGRTYEEGKKIGWKDGVEAIWCILKHNLG